MIFYTISSIFIRLLVLAVCTFLFVVLFEHGPMKFGEGIKTEWHLLISPSSKPAKADPSPAGNKEET